MILNITGRLLIIFFIVNYLFNINNIQYKFLLSLIFFFCCISANLKKMIKTLSELSIESFFTCKKTKLSCSYYCLFLYIYILMNKREIYFLCNNTHDYICFNYPKDKFCKHCERLQKFNLLYQKIENEKKQKTFKLIHLVNEITNHILKYKKYYILPELSNKQCDLYHLEEL